MNLKLFLFSTKLGFSYYLLDMGFLLPVVCVDLADQNISYVGVYLRSLFCSCLVGYPCMFGCFY